jgi:hypothetical protein
VFQIKDGARVRCDRAALETFSINESVSLHFLFSFLPHPQTLLKMFALRRAATAVPRTPRSVYTLSNSLGALRPALNASLKPSNLNHWRAMSNFAGETQRAFIQRMSNEDCAYSFLILLLVK